METVTTELSPRSQAKRRAILEVSAELFSERGFEKTSLKALAAEAQVSTSTIYTYFEDKDDLLEQAICARLDALLEAVAAETDEADDPIESLIRRVRLIHRRVAADPLICRIIVYQRHVVGGRLREHVERVTDSLNKMGTESLRRAIAAGNLGCEDPEALNDVFRLCMQGWVLNSLRGTQPISEQRVTEALVGLVRAAAREQA